MSKCFWCQQETGKPEKVYYRFKKLGESNFSTSCCENCWNNHKNQILKEDKNIISVSGEQNNLHQIVYTQAKCSKCNKPERASCQCSLQENEWRCLDCRSSGDIENMSDENWCKLCASKHLEIKANNLHFTTNECSSCHKVKEIDYHNLSGRELREQKERAKENWEESNEWCRCSVNENSPRIPSDKPSPSSSNPSTNNPNKSILKNPLVIGGIVIGVLSVIGLVIYFINQKKDHE